MYKFLVPIIFIRNVVKNMLCSYPYASSEELRKMLKSFSYNVNNESNLIHDMGPVLYVKYSLHTAVEGIDFNVNYPTEEEVNYV